MYTREPNTYKATGKWVEGAIDHAEEVLEHIRTYNLTNGYGDHTPTPDQPFK